MLLFAGVAYFILTKALIAHHEPLRWRPPTKGPENGYRQGEGAPIVFAHTHHPILANVAGVAWAG